ncbi:MAG: hypothetical protein LC664_01220 [Flavobacteriales bacterium]|nr:hypothetical protein [Flavobacteriales bacterium]
MKQKNPLKTGFRPAGLLSFLAILFATANQIHAQESFQASHAETAILALQTTNTSRNAVGPEDKSLLEKALQSVDFEEKRQEITTNIYVMMHGIEHRSIPNFTLDGKPVILLSKAALLAKNPRAFFIVKDIQRTANHAYIDIALHYDFEGNYENTIETELVLTKVGEQWTKQDFSQPSTR